MPKTTSKVVVKKRKSVAKKVTVSAKKGTTQQGAWLAKVEAAAKLFAKQNKAILSWSDRQLSAAFEIGCFHALLGFYETQKYKLIAANLIGGHYRYVMTQQFLHRSGR